MTKKMKELNKQTARLFSGKKKRIRYGGKHSGILFRPRHSEINLTPSLRGNLKPS